MPFRRASALWSPSFLPYGRELVVTGNDTPVRIQRLRTDGGGLRTVAQPTESNGFARDVSVVATAPARGGRERERFRSDHVIVLPDWQPLPRR